MTSKKRNTKSKTQLSEVMISGIALVLVALYLCFRVYTFYLLPKSWRLILILAIVLLAGMFLFFSYLRKEKGRVLKIVEMILCVLMLVAGIALPYIEKKAENLFSNHIRTDVQDFHVYTFTEEYRRMHPELELPFSVTRNLLDYSDATFLYPESTSEAQAEALEQLNRELGGNANLQNKHTLWQTMQAFYNAEAECILLSDTVVDMLEETEEYANFRYETIILKTFRTEIEIAEVKSESLSQNPFTVFVAGNDTRSGILSIYGRTDVDILLTVNPKTAQALIISIPRDTYIPNPALDYGADKLTHLGNHGIMNTIEALNALYRINVKYYAAVNFNTFKTIIDTLGGLDIYNAYSFTGGGQTFPEGDIHLDGNEALRYVQIRYSLPSGDFDRNEHQAIVLKAIIQKLTSRAILEKAGDLLNNLSGTVATNIKPSSILELASQELVARHDWNIIYYHLGGYGTRAETVSMPGMQLYVVYPYSSQIIFVGEEIQRVLDGEILEQKELPDADKTVWEYN